MTDMILNADTLPEPLFQLVRSDKVHVCEMNGVITLTPLEAFDCTAEIYGMYSDGKMSVDKRLKQKYTEIALECRKLSKKKTPLLRTKTLK